MKTDDRHFYNSQGINNAEDSEIVIVSVKKSKQSRNNNPKSTQNKNHVVFQQTEGPRKIACKDSEPLRVVNTSSQGLKKNISAKRSRMEVVKEISEKTQLDIRQQPGGSSLSQRKLSAAQKKQNKVSIQ